MCQLTSLPESAVKLGRAEKRALGKAAEAIAAMATKTSSYRLQYLDWVRGLGALIMLQGHVFDSFLKSDLRPGGAYVFSQFAGGMPPAIFLFLTGVTLSFLMDSTERKGMAPLERVVHAFRRSRLPVLPGVCVPHPDVALRISGGLDGPVQAWTS